MTPELLTFLNLAVSAGSTWLEGNKLEPWKNALIALVALALIGLLFSWANGFSTDIRINTLLVLANIGAAGLKFVQLTLYLYKVRTPLKDAPLEKQTNPIPLPTTTVQPEPVKEEDNRIYRW